MKRMDLRTPTGEATADARGAAFAVFVGCSCGLLRVWQLSAEGQVVLQHHTKTHTCGMATRARLTPDF